MTYGFKQQTYLTMRSLMEAAASQTGMPLADLMGPSRLRSHVRIRACVAHIANQERLACGNSRNTRWSLPRIAKGMGRKDHTTVCHLVEMWDTYCGIDPSLAPLAQRIRAMALGEIDTSHQPEAPKPEAPKPEAPISSYRKPKNDFRADELDGEDKGHRFHTGVAKASVKFAAALRETMKKEGEDQCVI